MSSRRYFANEMTGVLESTIHDYKSSQGRVGQLQAAIQKLENLRVEPTDYDPCYIIIDDVSVGLDPKTALTFYEKALAKEEAERTRLEEKLSAASAALGV